MRLGGPGQQVTCAQDHEYTAEQKAFNGGAMDQFVEHTEVTNCDRHQCQPPGLVMGYYDGNTVTASVELRSALRDERQLVQHHIRAVVTRGDEPDLGPNPRSRHEIHTRRRFPRPTTSSKTPATRRAP